MKSMTVLLAMTFVFLAWTSPLFAGDSRDLTPEDWAVYKQKFSGHPGVYMGEKPTDEMRTPEREWDSRCRVCPQHPPSCGSGYTQVGYTEFINMVYYQGWGTDNVGPGGFNRTISFTVTTGHPPMAEHDHIKTVHCRRN